MTKILKSSFIAISAFVFTLGCGKVLLHQLLIIDSIFIGLATLFIYSLPQHISSELKKKEKIILLSFSILILILSFFVFHTFKSFVLVTAIFCLSFFYVSSVFKQKVPVRNIPYIKALIIALSWVSACILFFFLNYDFKINWAFLLYHLFFFFSITICFDIRDVHIDTGKIKTLVTLVGIPFSKIIALISLLIFERYLVNNFHSYNFDIEITILTFYLGILIVFSKSSFLFKAYDLLVDSCIVFLGLIYFFA